MVIQTKEDLVSFEHVPDARKLTDSRAKQSIHNLNEKLPRFISFV